MKMSENEWRNLLEQIENNLYPKESLDLNYQDLTDNDMPDFLGALKKNTNIKCVNLYENQISDAGAIELATNQTLISLNLYGNQIGMIGATDLAPKKRRRSGCFAFKNPRNLLLGSASA
jgi:hypothetical protein